MAFINVDTIRIVQADQVTKVEPTKYFLYYIHIWHKVSYEEFEETKGVIRNRKSKKDRQYNGGLYLMVRILYILNVR